MLRQGETVEILGPLFAVVLTQIQQTVRRM